MLSKLKISMPSLLLSGFLSIAQFVNGFTDARTGGYLEIAHFWYALAFYWALGWWFISDSRRHDSAWVDKYMDMGMFLYVGWIFLVPYYLFKTGGLKALYTIGLFLGASLGAYIMGVILYALISIF